jgi:pimeloyl-ACP methyl ester carboxylesterase
MILLTAAASARLLHAQDATRRTFVLVHGAWGGGWQWQKVDSILTARGHRVVRPTLTGLGERVHLGTPHVGLDTHVTDVVKSMQWERVRDVVLVGHSYGGMIIPGVADRLPDRVKQLVYLDAILPEPGESVVDIMPDAFVATVRRNSKDGFIVPSWSKADTVPIDVPQPLKTFTDRAEFEPARVNAISAVYILTYEENGQPDAFQRFADRAARKGWPVHRMIAGHLPHRMQPVEFVDLLLRVTQR